MTKKLDVPCDTDAEEIVLGYLLGCECFSALYDAQTAGLNSGSFYDSRNGLIFIALEELSNSKETNSLTGICQKLRESSTLAQAGGLERISSLATFVGLGDFLAALKRVVELSTRRKILDLCRSSAIKATNETNAVDTVISELDSGITGIEKQTNGDTTITAGTIAKDVMPVIEKMVSGEKRENGLMTGFPLLDRSTNGLQRGTMVVIGARPSVGKTSLAMNIIEYALNRGANVLFFSLEMDNSSIFKKLLATKSSIPFSRMRDSFINQEQIDLIRKTSLEISGSSLLINDNSDLSINQIRSIARQKNHRKQLDLIVVDYLQFVRVPGNSKQSREQAVGEISRGLKAMAKELSVPVLVLSQLSRDSDKGERRPRLSDLRDSGSIEQDLDVGVFLWPNKDEDCVEMIIAKNRTGQTGSCKLRFDAPVTRFMEML